MVVVVEVKVTVVVVIMVVVRVAHLLPALHGQLHVDHPEREGGL